MLRMSTVDSFFQGWNRGNVASRRKAAIISRVISVFRNQNRMANRSASDDFKQITLRALPHLWEKLEFLASMRSELGTYQHWGLSQIYGQDEAETAISAAHDELFLQALSTPIQDLWADALRSELSDGNAFSTHVEQLQLNEQIIPRNVDGGACEHLDFILHVLCLLARSHQQTSTVRSS